MICPDVRHSVTTFHRLKCVHEMSTLFLCTKCLLYFRKILVPFHSFAVRKPEGREKSWPKASISAIIIKDF